MPLGSDRHRHIDRPVGDLPVPDLHVHAVDEDDRVDAVQRTVLPFRHAGHHAVGDRGDRGLGDLRAVHLGEMRGDLPVRQPLRRQRQDHLIHPAQTPLTLLDQLRLERPRPVPRHRDLDRPRLGDHRLGPVPVAVVLPAALGPLTGLVPQMIRELALQRRLQHPLRQLLQQAALPGELHPTGESPGNQLGDQPVIHGTRRTHSGLPGLGVTRHVSHQLSLPARELHRSPCRPASSMVFT